MIHLHIAGYDVTGVYMQNWNDYDEHGYCTGEQDYHDAQTVAETFKIPLKKLTFEKEYWIKVFRYEMIIDYILLLLYILLYHSDCWLKKSL